MCLNQIEENILDVFRICDFKLQGFGKQTGKYQHAKTDPWLNRCAQPHLFFIFPCLIS
nr:MAG TPA: hypothetical protein [Caudoviricetes sp.]